MVNCSLKETSKILIVAQSVWSFPLLYVNGVTLLCTCCETNVINEIYHDHASHRCNDEIHKVLVYHQYFIPVNLKFVFLIDRNPHTDRCSYVSLHQISIS